MRCVPLPALQESPVVEKTWLGDLMRFGMVGGLGFVVDVGVFNLLRLTVLSGDQNGAPLIAKIIALLAAIAVNWAGNRWWAFRDRRGARVAREAISFLALGIASSLVSLVCLAVSHYVLGLTSPLADNISANVIGVALGTVIRFFVIRGVIFAPSRPVEAKLAA
jgi:putative flippase GtrA